MEAVGSGPFRVGSLVWQSRPGAFVFSVICKVTFELQPGAARLSDSPSPLVPFDVLQPGGARDRAGASLSAASDLVPFKVTPELLVTGHVYSPGGRPAPQLVARIAIGAGGKALSVHGDRHFSPTGELSEAAPFTRMPLVWERAAGGPDTANPAGVVTGSAAVPDASGRVVVPNLLPIARFFPARNEVIAPVGSGPISPLWPGRRACLRGHAASWDTLRWSERPLPPDFDGAYFQAAPADQAVSEIAAEERIYLENLHPEWPQLLTRLPRCVPRAAAEISGATSPLALRCDTLTIDTDRATATLTYRGNVPIDHPHRAGRVIVTEEPTAAAAAAVPAQIGPSAPAASPAPAPPAASPAPAPPAAPGPESPPPAQTMTVLPLGDAPRPALPFEPPSTEMAAILAALPPDLREKMAARLARLGDLSAVSVSGTTLPVSSSKPVLPFSADSDDADEDGDTQRPPPPDAPAPPGPGAPPAPAVPTLAFVVPAAWKSAGFSVSQTLALPDPAAPAEGGAGSPDPAAPADTHAVPFRPAEAPAIAPSPPPEISPAEPPATAPAPEPPPMIGPLARPAEEPSAPAAAQPSSTSPPADPAPPAADPLPTIEDYPVERYARIEASLGLCGVEGAGPDRRSREEVLAANELTAEGFDHLRSIHRGRIDEQARHGKSLLARAYDASYVATVEAERGPITESEYVEIVLALDAGAAEVTLARLHLPRDAAMPIRRRWIARMAADPRLAARIRRAIAEERAR